MKKLILLTLVVAGMATSAFAQTSDTYSKVEDAFKKYRFGIFLGPTFNSLKPTADVAKDNNGDYKVSSVSGKTGFSFGLNMELNMSEKYTIYTGLGLDWNGGTMNASYDSTGGVALNSEYAHSAEVDYKTQYMSIPLGLKMYAFEVSDIKIFAQTGVDLSLLLSQKGNYSTVLNDSAMTVKSEESVKLNDYGRVLPINIGWHIGAGAEYGLSNGSAVYGAILYRNGFTDVTTPKLNASGYRFADGNIRSNTIAVRIGYFF